MIGICDICRYGQTDKCTNPERKSPRECFVSHSGTTIAEKKIRNATIDEVLEVVEWDGYTFDIKERIEQLKEKNNGRI